MKLTFGVDKSGISAEILFRIAEVLHGRRKCTGMQFEFSSDGGELFALEVTNYWLTESPRLIPMCGTSTFYYLAIYITYNIYDLFITVYLNTIEVVWDWETAFTKHGCLPLSAAITTYRDHIVEHNVINCRQKSNKPRHGQWKSDLHLEHIRWEFVQSVKARESIAMNNKRFLGMSDWAKGGYVKGYHTRIAIRYIYRAKHVYVAEKDMFWNRPYDQVSEDKACQRKFGFVPPKTSWATNAWVFDIFETEKGMILPMWEVSIKGFSCSLNSEGDSLHG